MSDDEEITYDAFKKHITFTIIHEDFDFQLIRLCLGNYIEPEKTKIL